MMLGNKLDAWIERGLDYLGVSETVESWLVTPIRCVCS